MAYVGLGVTPTTATVTESPTLAKAVLDKLGMTGGIICQPGVQNLFSKPDPKCAAIYAQVVAQQALNPSLSQAAALQKAVDEKRISETGKILAPPITKAEVDAASSSYTPVKKASILGMDLENPATLASLGLVALAFILRER